jgi:hypothetical protein
MVASAAAICACIFIASLSLSAQGDSDGYQLDVTVNDTDVGIVSGNLTAAITREWPWVVFHHTLDPWGPTFGVSYNSLYLFNDTNGDGVFARSEATAVVNMGSEYSEWILSPVERDHDPVMGEFAQFSMTCTLSAERIGVDGPVQIENWANVTFWFRITELPMTYTNSIGEYVVQGKTEILTRLTITINNSTGDQGVVLEQRIDGGGKTNLLLLKEMTGRNVIVYTEANGRIDESLLSTNFTHPFRQTDEAMQRIQLCKEDRTVQAFYYWDTEAVVEEEHNERISPIVSSYYTMGTGMVLHSEVPLSNSTLNLNLGAIVGIDEAGFSSMRDWLKENIPLVVGLSACVAAVVVLSVMYTRRKKKLEL